MKFNYKQLKQDRKCIYHIFDVHKTEEVFDIDGYYIFCKSKYESTNDETVVNKFHFDVFKVYSNIHNSIVNLEPSITDKLKYCSKIYTFPTQEEALEVLKANMDAAIIEMVQTELGI